MRRSRSLRSAAVWCHPNGRAVRLWRYSGRSMTWPVRVMNGAIPTALGVVANTSPVCTSIAASSASAPLGRDPRVVPAPRRQQHDPRPLPVPPGRLRPAYPLLQLAALRRGQRDWHRPHPHIHLSPAHDNAVTGRQSGSARPHSGPGRRHDEEHARDPAIHLQLHHPAPARPRREKLAPGQEPARQVQPRVRLRHRRPARPRQAPAPVPAPLRRLRPLLRLRLLLLGRRTLRRLPPDHRQPRRNPAGST
jgi:hypothetical protein